MTDVITPATGGKTTPMGIAQRFASIFAESHLAQRAANAIQPPVRSYMTTHQELHDVLHGRSWFGHPLHPVLTDVPIGAWTMAMLFDMLPASEKAADVCIGVGLLAALPTALCGINDWSETSGAASRTGVAHAAFNIAATACFAASFVARRAQSRKTGVRLQFAGNALATMGAMLGGHLVYDDALGVKREDDDLSALSRLS